MFGTICNFGIAFYRILYIRVPNFVKQVGEFKLLAFIGIGEILISFVFTIMYSFYGEVTGRHAYNSCLGITEKFQVNNSSFSIKNEFSGLHLSLVKHVRRSLVIKYIFWGEFLFTFATVKLVFKIFSPWYFLFLKL